MFSLIVSLPLNIITYVKYHTKVKSFKKLNAQQDAVTIIRSHQSPFQSNNCERILKNIYAFIVKVIV